MLRLLLVEDSDDDALLVTRVLKRHEPGVEIERVETLEALDTALAARQWDVVVSDFHLGRFTGLDALRVARRHDPDLPLVLVSATIGEETAVEAMRAGANDYVMKNNLARLLPAVQREARELQARREGAAVHRAQQEGIERLSRVKAVMSAINAAIVRVRDRDELFREACRIAVEDGRFVMAWIGVASADSPLVSPIAHHGMPGPLFEQVRTALREAPSAADPVARAVRERRSVVSNDIDDDARVLLKPQLLLHGVRALVALPLLVANRAEGVLMLYARELGAFDDEEMRLLEELAGDIGYALDHIRKQEELDYLAYYDSVTGLPNRTLFSERLGQLLESAGREQRRLAVLAVDLDRFRAINDTFGRQVGDTLLRQVGSRVSVCAGAGHVARVGADNFALLISGFRSERDIADLVREQLEPCFDDPFQLHGTEQRVTARVGIALYPDDGTTADLLLRNADAAASRAKASGDRYLFYTEQMTARVAEKRLMENRLRQAIANEQFVLHYQPKVDFEWRRIVAVEALIRWRSPEMGLVAPGQFIPVLEETGMIVEVGTWVLRQAIRDRGHWQGLGLAAPTIAVNVSVTQLQRHDFVDIVRMAIAGGPVPPGIDLEIVESLAMEDTAASIDKLKALRALGLGLAIDDFGTGYSSLGYLAKLPVQALKIDRSFVVSMLEDAHARTLVATIISLAHSLGLTVIAEGVETESQARALRALGCDQMQGYLTGRPVPRDEMTAWLRERPALASGISR